MVRLIKLFFLVNFLVLILFNSTARAATIMMSPGDSFASKISQLNPGDTLLLRDGTYTAANSGGMMSITCGTNAQNGTSSAPITIKAEHERKAHIKGDGTKSIFVMSSCSWWVVEGLHMENADNSAGEEGGLILVKDFSKDVVIRKNLVHHPNRWLNASMIQVYNGAERVVVEENEVYFFHRNAIDFIDGEADTKNCVARRNYVNPRDGRSTCPSGSPRCEPSDPSDAIVLYRSNDHIIENNITENSKVGISNTGSRNKFYGNIAINSTNLFLNSKHPREDIAAPTDAYYENNVGIAGSGTVNGFLFTSYLNTTVRNMSIFGGSGNGYSAGNKYDPRNDALPSPPYNCDPYGACTQQNPSVTVENFLVNGTAGGYLVDHASQFSLRKISYSVGWNNANGTWRSGTETRETATTPPSGVSSSPDMGNCKVWIPASSSLKGRGKNGADIGANILYRYKDGVLTNQPLWNTTTGEFPHGAIVAGVNDIAGQSAFDVHTRLNVNRNGCSFPSGFGAAANDLVAHWKLDETSGSTTVDASGRGNNGTLINPSAMFWTAGKVNNALNFDGTTGYVDVPSASVLNPDSGSFSYGLWTNFDTTGITGTNWQIPFWKGGSGNSTAGYDLEFDQNTNTFYANLSDGTGAARIRATYVNNFRDGVWHHIFVVADRSANLLKLYVDGQFESQASIAAGFGSVSSASPVNLSRTNSPFKGKLDDVRIYNYALDAASVADLYNSQANQPPVLNAIGNKSVNENTNLNFIVSGSDPNGGTLTYSASGLPSGSTFTASTRTFNWTPSNTQAGSYSVTFTVSDGNLTDSETITITVNNVNRPPVLSSITDKTIVAGVTLGFTVSGSDPDGDALTYSYSPLLSGATLNATTGIFSWTPTAAQAGTYNLIFTAQDPGTLSSSQAMTITVQPAFNFSLSAGNVTVNRGSSVNSTVTATLTSGATQAVSFSASSLTGTTFTFAPGSCSPGCSTTLTMATTGSTPTGSHTITVTGTGGGVTKTATLTLIVQTLTPPKLYLKLNETGGSTAADASGSGYNGTLVNPSSMSWVAGKYGNALSFNSDNGYVNIPNPSNGGLNFGTGSFSYGFWVNFKTAGSSVSSWQIPFGKGGSSTSSIGFDIEFSQTSNRLDANLQDGVATKRVSYAYNFRDGLWHHVFAVVDRSNNVFSLYVDGQLRQQTSLTGLGSVSSSNPVNLSKTSNPFKGKLDEVRIYNKALTSTEVQSVMNGN